MRKADRISFHAVFERAHHRGVNPVTAAQQLLSVLADPDSGYVVWGLLREFDDDDREVLPRRLFHEPIPSEFWSIFTGVAAGCVSEWVDNADDPEELAFVDWVSGTASQLRWEWSPELSRPMRRWSALELAGPAVPRLIDDLVSGDVRQRREELERIRRTFISEFSGVGGVDQAYRDWMNHPAYDRIKQREFRLEYKEIRGERGPGAPKKSVRKSVRTPLS